jgi:uncharacterized protein (TIGR03083 family)
MALGRPARAFFEAADMASGVLADEAIARSWSEPSALQGFSVGGLAGHLYAAARRLEVALDEPIPESPVSVGLAEFYGVNRVEHPDELIQGLHPVIRQDGEQRAQQGPHQLTTRFIDLIARLRARLPEEPDDRLVPVIQVAGGVTALDAYLATRVVELVVHTDDLAASVDAPAPSVPLKAASVAIEVFVALARARSGDLGVIRGFARQERSLPDALRAL